RIRQTLHGLIVTVGTHQAMGSDTQLEQLMHNEGADKACGTRDKDGVGRYGGMGGIVEPEVGVQTALLDGSHVKPRRLKYQPGGGSAAVTRRIRLVLLQ